MYDHANPETAVEKARKITFAQIGRKLDKIPPARDALVLHKKWAVMQASHSWSHSEEPYINLPSPKDWGWTQQDTDNERWTPILTTLPPATQFCLELLKC